VQKSGCGKFTGPLSILVFIESTLYHPHHLYIYREKDFLTYLSIYMAYLLPHLHSGWEVDQAILHGEDRVVVVRFGRDANTTCMVQDEILANIAEKVKNFAVVYLVDIDEVPDFIHMYELYDDCTTMFFYRNKHIMVDLGTGDNNKINWAVTNKQELIDIIEIVYRGARKGRGLVISPKDYSTKYRY
jgi:U5 snRNP protein, DIM1 family